MQALPSPAYGLDRLWNACCWNHAAEDLFAGWLGEGCPRNLLRYTFTAPSARALLPDWEHRARRVLAEFRADSARILNTAELDDLVRQLREESALFAQEWETQTVMAREGGLRTFVHPRDGLVSYAQHTFSPIERPDYKLVALIPSPDGAR